MIIKNKYDDRGNIIHSKNSSNNWEFWQQFDKNNNIIHFRDNKNEEYWKKYDENNNEIHFKDNSGYEEWAKWDKKNRLIYYTENEDNYKYFYKYNIFGKRKEITKKKFKKKYKND